MKTQWQHYQELELIPASLPEPKASQTLFGSWLEARWRSLANVLANESAFGHQPEYLEKCLKLDCSDSIENPGFWLKVWKVLNQPIGGERSPTHSAEPQIQQIADYSGHLWWRAYDPLTGQTTYLDSEQEVHVWLDERL